MDMRPPTWLVRTGRQRFDNLLFSWWPHDSLHIANGTNMSGLLAIEYGFHVTVMAAGAILVYAFIVAPRRHASPSR
jgi:hypothetical protein